MMVKVGTKVVGYWGKMAPIQYGKVVSISPNGDYATINWNNEIMPYMSMVVDICDRHDGTTAGIFILPS